MTWYENIEKKRTLLVSGIIAICIAALAVTARRNPISFDSYWHLQTGLDWINRGLSPWVDHFSFTYSGHAIGGQPFIFQALLAWLVSNLGLDAGFEIYKLASFLLAFGLFIWFLKKIHSPVIVYLMLLPLFVLLLQLRSTVRPELISYSFSIIAVMLYHRAHGHVTTRNMVPICLLMFFWSNYHSSILGYILFFGFFIDAAIVQYRERAHMQTWGKWFGWGIAVLAVGFLNKDFGHPIIGIFSFAPQWKVIIQEYHSAIMYSSVKAVYALMALTLVTMYLAVRQRKFGYLVVTIIFTYFSIKTARLVTPCGVIVLALFASLVSESDIKQTIQKNNIFSSVMGVGVLLISLVSLYSSVNYARLFMGENRTSAIIRPEMIVDYMKNNQISGRIFNDFGIGGFLIYSLSPESQVYIDGRSNILYPLAHFKRFYEARNNPTVLREELERYDVNLAILHSDPRAYSVTIESGILGLDYVDKQFTLFKREDPRFPLLGKLIANPTCWSNDNSEKLESEYIEAIWDLPTNSSLLPIAGLMFNFSQADDRRKYLENFEKSTTHDAFQLRFAANRALELGQYQISADLYEQIPIWDYREHLLAAIANVHLGAWLEAESIMDSLTKVKWPHVTQSDLVLQYRILETIRQSNSLKTIPESYVSNLEEQLGQLDYSTTSLDLNFTMLCTQNES